MKDYFQDNFCNVFPLTDKTLQFTIRSVMGLAKLKTKISIENYLEDEETSQTEHEYINTDIE
jgi:hypothetical protein